MATNLILCLTIYSGLLLMRNGVCSVETKEAKKETVILVSMDGMGWQFISGQFADTPHLDAVGKSGVRAEYTVNVVPTKTWPNHHSYLTGLYPESHGIISNK